MYARDRAGDIYRPHRHKAGPPAAMRTFFLKAMACILLASTGNAPGQNIRLVKDINPGSAHSLDSTAEFYVGDNLAFFMADNGVSGRALWRTDATTEGTFILRDFDSSVFWPRPVGGLFFFVVPDPIVGTELWKSDGTAGGTILVEDIHPGMDPAENPNSSNPEYLTDWNGTLYFRARAANVDPQPGENSVTDQLWRSDGTGVEFIADSNVLQSTSAFTNAGEDEFGVTDNAIFFRGGTASTDLELWKSDGTEGGTVQVADINPSGFSTPSDIVGNGSIVAFSAVGSNDKRELWRSDGSAIGTYRLSDSPANNGAQPKEIVFLGDRIVFNHLSGTNIEPWVSNGAPDDAQMLKDVRPGDDFAAPLEYTVVGDTLFFVDDDGDHGRELWKTDGTTGGTVMVKDIRPGSTSSFAGSLVTVGGILFFIANDGSGTKIWRSNGTEDGTVAAFDEIPQGVEGSFIPRDLAVLQTTLLISASASNLGIELFAVDIAELVPGEPTGPAPPDGSRVIAEVDVNLQWDPAAFAQTYDVFFWPIASEKPAAPTATDISSTILQVEVDLGAGYLWQVVAKNASGETPGPEWFFRNDKASKALQDHLLGIQPIDQEELDLLDTNADGKINVADVINWITAEP